MTVHQLPSMTDPASVREWMKAVDMDLNNFAKYTEKNAEWCMIMEQRQRVIEEAMRQMALAMEEVAAYFRSITK